MAGKITIPLYTLIEHEKYSDGSCFMGVYGSAAEAQAKIAEDYGDGIEWTEVPAREEGQLPSYHASTPALAWYAAPCDLEAKGSQAFEVALLHAASAVLRNRLPLITQDARMMLAGAARAIELGEGKE